jgi:hypothetical protein
MSEHIRNSGPKTVIPRRLNSAEVAGSRAEVAALLRAAIEAAEDTEDQDEEDTDVEDYQRLIASRTGLAEAMRNHLSSNPGAGSAPLNGLRGTLQSQFSGAVIDGQ